MYINVITNYTVNYINVMKKVISFSLYGNKACYQTGAIINIIEAKRLLPDWICRFYTTDATVVKKQLTYLGAEIVDMKNDSLCHAKMFWRFLAVDDPEVETVIFRDADSVISERELPCLDKWLNSEEEWQFNVIRDHPSHLSVPILGGMWGYTNLKKTENYIDFKKKSMRSYIYHDWIKGLKRKVNRVQDDQRFLKWFYENVARHIPGPSKHPGAGILRFGPQGHKIPDHETTRYTTHIGARTFSKGAKFNSKVVNGYDEDWYNSQSWRWWQFNKKDNQ